MSANRPGAEPARFSWAWADRRHLDAHLNDFLVPPATLLKKVYNLVANRMPAPEVIAAAGDRGNKIWFHDDIEMAEPVGLSGIRNICDEPAPSFWAYRAGRDIPSHLCTGEKEPTYWLCLWGHWEPDRFVIHTMYPGRVAPREIHDPSLPLDDLQESIEFWRCHALVVAEGEFTATPAGLPSDVS